MDEWLSIKEQFPKERWETVETPRYLVGYWHKGKWVNRIARPRAWGGYVGWLTVPGDWAVTPTHFQPEPLPPNTGKRIAANDNGTERG